MSLWGFILSFLEVYAALAIYTFFLSVTVDYLACPCYRRQSFGKHLQGVYPLIFVGHLAGALLWPIAWYQAHTRFRADGNNLAGAMKAVALYWFFYSWHGRPLR
jgi:hypothetical protein